MSLSWLSAQRLSMPLNCIQSHHLQSGPRQTRAIQGYTAPRKRRRGFAPRIQVELNSSSYKAPTSSRSIYLREIHRQIDHNEKCSSAGLLTAPSSFAMKSTLPWAKATLLHLRRFVPSPRLCPLPLFHRLIEANQLQQVPWPPSAAYAAGQDYAA